MTWPDPITVRRPDGTLTLDAESGQPTNQQNKKTIFSGFGRITMDEKRIERMIDGNEHVRDHGMVYLPPGSWGIKENDEVESDDHVGYVKELTHFRNKYYTRLLVRWDQTP